LKHAAKDEIRTYEFGLRNQLPNSSLAEVAILDLLGKKIRTLVNEKQDAGYYRIEFAASDLASGIYFYQLKVGDFI
jgi:hypothetical protein